MLGNAVFPGVLKDEQVQVKGNGKPDAVSQTPVSCQPPRTSPGTPLAGKVRAGPDGKVPEEALVEEVGLIEVGWRIVAPLIDVVKQSIGIVGRPRWQIR